MRSGSPSIRSKLPEGESQNHRRAQEDMDGHWEALMASLRDITGSSFALSLNSGWRNVEAHMAFSGTIALSE